MDQQQMQLEHEQNQSAIQAINAAEQDIRQHGLQVEQAQFQQFLQDVGQQAQQPTPPTQGQ